MKVQRLRFRYRLTSAAACLSHRELISAWESAAAAARLPLAHSEGKRPAPQISIAALLPLGVTSDCELADVFLSERVEVPHALSALSSALASGIEPIAVEEVGVSSPSLQSLVRWAEYEVEVPISTPGTEDAQSAVETLLSADSLPSEYRREMKIRRYDLRPLILNLWLAGLRDDHLVLVMRLRAEPEKTARADQVILALGLPPPARVHRRRLYVDEAQAAVTAYRRLNEPADE